MFLLLLLFFTSPSILPVGIEHIDTKRELGGKCISGFLLPQSYLWEENMHIRKKENWEGRKTCTRSMFIIF